MPAGAPPADDATDLLKNLSLDSQTKPSQTTNPVKKPSVDTGNGQIQPSNKAVTPLVTDFMDPTLAYYPTYYYGGYDGATNDWDVYPRYMFPDGAILVNPSGQPIKKCYMVSDGGGGGCGRGGGGGSRCVTKRERG